MQEDEQRPGSKDIDHSDDSTAEGGPGDVHEDPSGAGPPKDFELQPEESTPVPVDVKSSVVSTEATDRTPIASAGYHVLPLVISGVVATIMTVAFIAGVETIFPVPVSESTVHTTPSSSEPAPATTDSKPTAADSKPAATDSKPTATDSKPPATDTKPAATDTKPAATDTKKADEGSSARRSVSLGGFVASLVPVAAADAGTSAEADSRPDPWGRFVILIKFAVLVFLGVGCGLVTLGGLALALDRPLGSLPNAASQMLATCWLATLALLVPAPTEWLLAPIHYVVAALIFWASTIIFFRFSARNAGMLLGGTMALLAVTAIGSQIVVWATWS